MRIRTDVWVKAANIDINFEGTDFEFLCGANDVMHVFKKGPRSMCGRKVRSACRHRDGADPHPTLCAYCFAFLQKYETQERRK